MFNSNFESKASSKQKYFSSTNSQLCYKKKKHSISETLQTHWYLISLDSRVDKRKRNSFKKSVKVELFYKFKKCLKWFKLNLKGVMLGKIKSIWAHTFGCPIKISQILNTKRKKKSIKPEIQVVYKIIESIFDEFIINHFTLQIRMSRC